MSLEQQHLPAYFVHETFKVLTRSRLRLKCDGTRAKTRFRLSAKRTSPFKSAGASVQSTTGSRGVRISGSNAGYTMLRGSVKGTGCPLHSPVFPSLPPSRASQWAYTFQTHSTFWMGSYENPPIQPENGHYQTPKHVVGLYVINNKHISPPDNFVRQ